MKVLENIIVSIIAETILVNQRVAGMEKVVLACTAQLAQVIL